MLKAIILVIFSVLVWVHCEKQVESGCHMECGVQNCKDSDFLNSSEELKEKWDNLSHNVTVAVYYYNIGGIKSFNHTALYVPAFGGAVEKRTGVAIPYWAEISLKDKFRPTLHTQRDTDSKFYSGMSFDIKVSQEWMHQFSVTYDHNIRYWFTDDNCQAFTWFLLVAHGVDETKLHGIFQFHDGNLPVNIKTLARRCRSVYPYV